MDFNDEHNSKSTIFNDAINVNDICSTHTANFIANGDYNIILMRYLQKKTFS